jgi:hypothetical protein
MVTGSSCVEAGTTWDSELGPDGHYLHVDHLASGNPSLASISDLPFGWEAERASQSEQWIRLKCGARGN